MTLPTARDGVVFSSIPPHTRSKGRVQIRSSSSSTSISNIIISQPQKGHKTKGDSPAIATTAYRPTAYSGSCCVSTLWFIFGNHQYSFSLLLACVPISLVMKTTSLVLLSLTAVSAFAPAQRSGSAFVGRASISDKTVSGTCAREKQRVL